MTVAAALLLVLLTYPAFEPDYGTGLDSSYVWGLNYLFDNDYATLTSLVYPYGPLAMLRLPCADGGHYAWFLLFYSAVKLAFVLMTFGLARRHTQPWLATVVTLAPACLMGSVDTYVVLDVALLAMLEVERRRGWSFALATLLAVFALAIKSSIGIEACGVLFAAWVIMLFDRSQVRHSLLTAAMVPVTLAAVGLAVWHSIPAMLQAYGGMMHLVDGYAESLVLEPEHRLWALAAFVLLMAGLFATLRGRDARYMFLLLTVPLFAVWKHAVVREDHYHFYQLLNFVPGMVVVTGLSQRGLRWPAWCCGAAAFGMLLVNMAALVPDGHICLTTATPRNVVDRVVGYRALVRKSQQVTSTKLERLRLPAGTRAMIGEAMVDCYPWEHVYVAANGLRWQPHTTVELGAGNSPALNRLSARNFDASDSAVQYVLLHRVDYSGENGLRSLDGRYLLNDEPAVFDALLSNYSVADSGSYGLLLIHKPCETTAQDNSQFSILNSQFSEVGWDEWVTLPGDDCLTRVGVSVSKNLCGHLRSIFYKPDIYLVDYRLPDGSVATYRFSPATAADGLWVGPLATTYAELHSLFDGTGMPASPVAIRLRCNHPLLHKPTSQIEQHILVVRSAVSPLRR